MVPPPKDFSYAAYTDADPKSTLLENCATDINKFWMITAADQLGTVFKTIGTNITKLRVSQ